MGGLSRRFGPWLLGSLAAAVVLLSVFACENALQTYFFKNLFYDGWQITSWTVPAPVVDGETHLVEVPQDLSNGFPMGLAVGDNGRVHVIGYRVSQWQWVYTSKAPNADRFDQAYTVIGTSIYPGGTFTSMPHIEVLAGDALLIAYSDEVSGDDHLFFQEYVPASGWYTEDDLYYDTVSGEDITQTFVFFLASDFKPHLFFVSANSLYHTVRTGSGSINPDPPEELVAGVNTVDIERINTDELAIAYTDTAAKNLYFRTYHDTQAETVWTAGDPDTVIASIDIAVDATGAVHICFATKDSTAPVLDPSGSAIRYVCNQQGTWTEMNAILGNDQAGPDTIMPHAITLSTDKFGNPRLHLVYSLLKDGLNFYIWYAYFDKGSWHAAKESIDTVNTNSFWTSAMIGADGGGNVHIVYSWAVNELDRTLMYVRGSPTEPQ